MLRSSGTLSALFDPEDEYADYDARVREHRDEPVVQGDTLYFEKL